MNITMHDTVRVATGRIHEAPWNANVVDDATMAKIRRSLRRYGSVENCVVRPAWCIGARSPAEVSSRRAALMDDNYSYEMLSGNHRLRIYREEGVEDIPCVVTELPDAEAKVLAQVLNRTRGDDDPERLKALLADVVLDMPATDVASLLPQDENMLAALLAGEGGSAPSGGTGYQPTPMVDQFIVPPFTVLDARQGYWRTRKRAWIDLGIRSELGRGDVMPSGQNSVYAGSAKWAGYRGPAKDDQPPRRPTAKAQAFSTQASGMVSYTGTSIFDPVLCELIYRWFSPQGGAVLDPFGGGSVRGVVAAIVGRRYVGIDLQARQTAANNEQWAEIQRRLGGHLDPDNIVDQTPVQRCGDYWLKRDDHFCVGGVRGGKVRTCWALAQGATGLVTAGSRMSPQCNIVAHVARALGIPCRIHVPSGDLSPELEAAREAGAEVIQHRPGYNTVIIARAREDAAEQGWTEIPFGMECVEAPKQTATQVASLPDDIKRLVVPVGSGMSLAGILYGLREAGRKVPVLGVLVGADPSKRLDEYAPDGWRDQVTLVTSDLDYHVEAPEMFLGDVRLDAIYEAKCIPYLEPGDCLWVVGIRQTAASSQTWMQVKPVDNDPVWLVGDALDVDALLPPEHDVDLVFSCPPYADLEVYSDDPRDLSTMAYDDFLKAYGEIVKRAIARLKDNRFACFVVGDVRDGDGVYRNFVSHTIAAFEDAGARLYNEAVLVTSVGSLPLRAGRSFKASRKLGKAHQNVLLFVKGDPLLAAQACGSIDVTFPSETGNAPD